MIIHFARQGQVDVLIRLERRPVPREFVNRLKAEGKFLFQEGRLWFIAPRWLKVMHDTCYSDAYHQQADKLTQQRNLEALTAREFPKE